jgi:hypothetical protein
MQPKKDASSRKKPSRLEKFPWNLYSFFEERLQVDYSSKMMRQGVDHVLNGVLSVQAIDIRDSWSRNFLAGTGWCVHTRREEHLRGTHQKSLCTWEGRGFIVSVV